MGPWSVKSSILPFAQQEHIIATAKITERKKKEWNGSGLESRIQTAALTFKSLVTEWTVDHPNKIGLKRLVIRFLKILKVSELSDHFQLIKKKSKLTFIHLLDRCLIKGFDVAIVYRKHRAFYSKKMVIHISPLPFPSPFNNYWKEKQQN